MPVALTIRRHLKWCSSSRSSFRSFQKRIWKGSAQRSTSPWEGSCTKRPAVADPSDSQNGNATGSEIDYPTKISQGSNQSKIYTKLSWPEHSTSPRKVPRWHQSLKLFGMGPPCNARVMFKWDMGHHPCDDVATSSLD